MQRVLALITLGFSLACARPAPDGAASSPASSAARPPDIGVDGCVESEELKTFVDALETQRGVARDAALAALGARREVRRGMFMDPGARKMGEVFELGGKRLAVVAEYARESEPAVAVALHGVEVRRLEERPHAHGVPVQACGVTPCRQAQQNASRRPVLPVAIELGPGETLGEGLVVTYDYWWAQVSHARRERCPSPS